MAPPPAPGPGFPPQIAQRRDSSLAQTLPGEQADFDLRLTDAGLVGSRPGAALRRFGLAVAPRFLWECLSIRTVSRFPVPATSNPSCRFPAMGSPRGFPDP